MSTLDDATLAQLRAAISVAASGSAQSVAALEYLERFKAAPTRVTASGGVGEPVDALEYAHALLAGSMAADTEVARLGAELTPLSLELERLAANPPPQLIEQYQQLSSSSATAQERARQAQTEAFWALNL